MKALTYIFLILTGAMILLNHSAASAQDSLKDYNNRRVSTELTGMKILGGWAIANIAAGTIGYAHTAGPVRSFYQMNILWNAANLGIATAGYLTNFKNRNHTLSPAESIKAQRQAENLFLINGILDLGYIGTGLYLKNRGDHKSSDQLQGYGSSVILQGAFLLLLDSILYTSERRSGRGLRRFLAENPITFNGREAGIIIALN